MRPAASFAVSSTLGSLRTLSVMQLNGDDLMDFKAIWKDEFGEELDDDAAREAASRLLELYRLLARAPQPKT